jgi:hypothetical protein
MKRAVVWAFLFLVLVLLVAQAIDSNRAELTREFAFKFKVPFAGDVWQSKSGLKVAEYFVVSMLIGGFMVMVLSLGAIIKANRLAKRAQLELEDCRAELARLRGPAEDDEVYQSDRLQENSNE